MTLCRHSKQGQVKPLTIVDTPADWTSSGLEGRAHEYTYTFTQDDTAELVAAVEKLKSSGVASEEDVKQVPAHPSHGRTSASGPVSRN